jgi:hypothetical protein
MKWLQVSFLLLLVGGASAQPPGGPPPTFDLLLRGGHVIDPRNKIDAIRDVAIRAGIRSPPWARRSTQPRP